jgi:hypothetical protein
MQELSIQKKETKTKEERKKESLMTMQIWFLIIVWKEEFEKSNWFSIIEQKLHNGRT